MALDYMLKHRGFPGRLPGTDFQFTLRRANPKGATPLERRERRNDRKPADRRADAGFIVALWEHFGDQPFERGNVNVRRACPGCSDGRSCRRKTPSIGPPAKRWRWSTRRCYAKATQRPSKKCLPSHRRLGSALSAVSEAGLWQTIANREAPVQGRTSNVIDVCQGRAGYAKVCSLLGIFLVKNLHFLSR